MEQQTSVEELQRQLTERIAALDKQRKEESERFEKELSERTQLADAERQRQLAEYKEQERKRDEKRRQEEEAEALRAKEEREAKIALEISLAKAEEARKAQEEKLKWLVDEINKQEFIEEQHRKSFEGKKAAIPSTVHEESTINVEHPEAPINTAHPGEAVQGTDGETPDTPLMSDHLKHILRQATRN